MLNIRLIFFNFCFFTVLIFTFDGNNVIIEYMAKSMIAFQEEFLNV